MIIDVGLAHRKREACWVIDVQSVSRKRGAGNQSGLAAHRLKGEKEDDLLEIANSPASVQA